MESLYEYKIKKYKLNKLDPLSKLKKDYASNIKEHLTYIPFKNFYDKIKNISTEMISIIKKYKYIYFLMLNYIKGKNELNKSNTWVLLLFWPFLRDELKHKALYIKKDIYEVCVDIHEQ